MHPSLSEEDIREQVVAILQAALRVPKETLGMESRVFDDLGAESIDILDIRFRIEAAFGFRIKEGEIIRSIDPLLTMEELKARFTVGSIVDFIARKQTQENA